jgi:2-C-methyl-D-erythritol 4-phosphate cytidylyltransferase
MQKNIALIIAGGSGNRMGQDIPKQFMHINGCPIIIHTMKCFQQHPDIDAIAVVCLKGWETVLQAYANQFNIDKLKWIFPGGDTGMQSIHNGIYGLR